MTSKQVEIKLFYCVSNDRHYIQIGSDWLLPVRPEACAKIAESEQLDVQRCNDIKEMQLIDKNNDNGEK